MRKSNKPSTLKQAPAPLSLRRAKAKFRFDAGRDDHALQGLTAFVFTTESALEAALEGRSCGTFGCPVGTLQGYAAITRLDGLRSVKQSAGYVQGRLVELTMKELSRLDQVAEYSGGNYHRFAADVVLPQAGHTVKAWVFQLLCDARPAELATSASAESASALSPV